MYSKAIFLAITDLHTWLSGVFFSSPEMQEPSKATKRGARKSMADVSMGTHTKRMAWSGSTDTVVKKGGSRKLRCPWVGPYKLWSVTGLHLLQRGSKPSSILLKLHLHKVAVER
jgi:hypothetical protein